MGRGRREQGTWSAVMMGRGRERGQRECSDGQRKRERGSQSATEKNVRGRKDSLANLWLCCFIGEVSERVKNYEFKPQWLIYETRLEALVVLENVPRVGI